MGAQTWVDLVVGGATAPVITDGPTLTAAARASCIPTANKVTLPNGFWYPGKKLRLHLWGRISCVVTTPGTARFDVFTGGVIVFDTGALGLNIVAKTTVPWWLDIDLTCRSQGAGTISQLMGVARFQSEAVVGAPLPTVGGNGSLLAPVGAPALGTGFDNTTANSLDVFFTQTVATGQLIVHGFAAEALG